MIKPEIQTTAIYFEVAVSYKLFFSVELVLEQVLELLATLGFVFICFYYVLVQCLVTAMVS